MSNTELIKELRSLTQAGMKDCKDALEETNWDLQKAVDVIKTKGLNVVSGREGKVAADGLVMIVDDGSDNVKAMIEVNCQTDFVARGQHFVNFATHCAVTLLDKTEAGQPFGTEDVEDARKALVALSKENVVVRRWWVEQATSPLARVFAYSHQGNKIGVAITLLASSEEVVKSKEFEALGSDLAMQVAAMSPLAISTEKLDPAEVARQKNIFETQLTELNKPAAAWPKILEGKFNKWYTEVCLLNQESVVLPKTTVGQVVKNVGTKLGGEVTVVNFIRCQVGEGIEKKQDDLAAEVAKLSGIELQGPVSAEDLATGNYTK